MTKDIIDLPKNADDWLALINTHSCRYFYIKGENLAVSLGSANSGTIKIMDIENVYKRGKKCTTYTLSNDEYETRWEVLKAYRFCCRSLLEACNNLPFKEGRYEGSYEPETLMGVTVYKSEDKAVSVFSPLHLDRLNPIKQIPKKWTAAHVVRLLANDQFEDLATRSRYTDDYAYDAAYNYGKGSYDKLDMIEKLVESPSGWWFNKGEKDGDYLGINCHSFDYKGCTIRLEGKTEIPEASEAISNVIPFKTALPEGIDRGKVAGILMA